jgi:hypothetical protein
VSVVEGLTQSACVGETVNLPQVKFSAASSGATKYFFDYKIGSTGATVTVESTTNEYILDQSTVNAGSFVVYLLAVRDNLDNSCTSGEAPVTLTVNAKPTMTNTTPASRCDAGTVTLGATASAGTLTWYAESSGGTSLGTGTLFTTPIISTTTTYWVDATNNGCISTRSSVVATVNKTPTVTVNSPVVCKDNTTQLTASPIGGASPYNYTWNTNPSQETKTITVSTAGTYSVTVTDNNGCVARGSGTVTTFDCKVFCTYTQGYYGNVGGKSCNGIGPDGKPAGILYSTTTERMRRAFGVTTAGIPLQIPNSVVFGKQSRIFTLSFSDVATTTSKIYTLLPGGGTPAPLNSGEWHSLSIPSGKNNTGSPLDSKGKIRNNLLAQTIVLWFNIQTSPGLGEWIMPSSFKTVKPACGTTAIDGLVPNTYNVPSGLAGLSINQLLEQANRALGALSTASSLSNIHTTVDMINRAFDECRYLVSSQAALSRVPILNPVEVVNANSSVNVISKVQLVTFPNPYIDQVTFNVTVKNAGKGSLVIYNMLGQKVTNLFEGNMQANSTQTIRYSVPFAQRKNLVYVFRQNETISTGKLVSGK